jgi:hypothetical protein
MPLLCSGGLHFNNFFIDFSRFLARARSDSTMTTGLVVCRCLARAATNDDSKTSGSSN